MSKGTATDGRSIDMHAAVSMFGYNPSAWNQRIPICVLAVIAMLIAGHMALFQWELIGNAWDPFFGDQTEKVLTSDIAKRMDRLIGIPDAALGALAYFGDAIFGLAGSTRRWQFRPWMVVLFGIDVIPLGVVSAVLVFCQAFILGQYCTLCIATAAISLILVYMAYDEVWVSCVYLWKVWKETKSSSILWKTFWGQPTPEGARIADSMLVGSAGRLE